MTPIMFRMFLGASMILCLQAASRLPFTMQTVADCTAMIKPNGLPDDIWLKLKPKLCQGKGKVNIQDAPEICAEMNGNQQHHPSCQVWKRKQSEVPKPMPSAIRLHSSSAQQNDRKVVLDCYMQTSLNFQDDSTCSEMISNRFSTVKAQDALAYYKVLSRLMSKIDWCLDLEEQMVPMPTNCSFLDELPQLVEHCYMYHQFDRYPACEHISWPQIALPVDVRTMYIYKLWQDINADFEYQLEEYRMGMEGNPDSMAVVMFCLHNSTWIGETNHQCIDVIKPKRNSTYTSKDRLHQKMYNQKRRDELRYDCLTFHKEEKLPKCKFITWR